MRNALAELLRPKTVNNWLIACKACWNWASRVSLLGENPFSKFGPVYVPGRTGICTADEFGRLMNRTVETFRQCCCSCEHTVPPGVVCQCDVRTLNRLLILGVFPLVIAHRGQG